MRILILGANGQLSTELEKALGSEEVLGLTHSQVDICDTEAVAEYARAFLPQCIINTAGFHRVDDCEEQVERSFAVNAVGVRGLVRVANEMEAMFVHFSTDYVFDGVQKRPYRESDAPNPLSVYAISKLAGEYVVRQYAGRYFLMRTCGLYGSSLSSGKSGNFVETMLRLARAGRPIRVVNDQVATPTSAKDLAEAILPLIRTQKYGLYHLTSAGACSWFEFATEVFRLANLHPDLAPISSAELGAKARRPAYSVLENFALREAGLPDLQPWQAALAEYMRDRRDW